MEPESRVSIGLQGIEWTWQTTKSSLPDSLAIHQPAAHETDDIPDDWFDWYDEAMALHPANDNWVCIASSKGGDWSHSWCRARNLISTLSRISRTADFLTRDIYISQLEFSERKRTVNAVAAMNVSFLDLDGKLARNQTPEEWRDVVLEHCRRYAIPEPNEMVFTGNGIHVKWIYTQPASRSHLERWNCIERLLFVQFEALGADAKALDAARVLRLPGTVNCKPGTEDNHVRIVHSSPAAFTFEEFAAKVEASIPVSEESFKACLEEWEKSHKATGPDPESLDCFTQNSGADIERAEEDWLLNTLVQHHPRDTWVNLSCEALGQSLWVQTYELHDTLKRLDFNRVWTMALSEFTEKSRAEHRLAVACIPCNFVVLPRCPGTTVEEKIENIIQHCREYRDVGIPEPNQFLAVGDTLIAEWAYDEVLPGRAVSRWNRTQEFLCRHFECWGAMDEPENMKATAYLPLPGFKSADGETARLAYHAPEIQYSFDTLATAVLHFSQQAVKEYKVEKAEEKARKSSEQKPRFWSNGDFRQIARRRYNDISHLLEMRKDDSGNVRQGSREKCVFWAMNFAIQAGEVTPLNFDSHAQSLIDFCGPRFRSECGVRVLTTLKRKLEKGEKTYHATDRKLIKELGITEDEQHEMLTLRADKSPKAKKERTPRQQWLEAHTQERNAPWKKQGISRRKFFKDKKTAREAAERELRRREARRQKVQGWMEARQIQRNTVNILIYIIRRNTYRALVSSYIMSAPREGVLKKYRYRVKGGFRKSCRGP